MISWIANNIFISCNVKLHQVLNSRLEVLVILMTIDDSYLNVLSYRSPKQWYYSTRASFLSNNVFIEKHFPKVNTSLSLTCYEIFLFYACVSFASMYMCALVVVRRGIPFPQKLELWMVVSHYMCAGNWTRVLCKSNKYT